MSGHSHWATIKHKKASEDARRGRAYTKVARMVSVAARKARTSGASPAKARELYENPSGELKTALEKARAVNMPKENILRAIERGLGLVKGGGVVEEGTVEGYGPGGTAFLVKILTDNRNRTLAEIRGFFSRFGGSLAEAGSTAYIFSQDPDKPSFLISVSGEVARKVLLLAKALEEHEDVSEVYTNFKEAQ